MINETEMPETHWTLDQLGAFCLSRHQRLAADAWAIGRAMCLAKERCDEGSQSFTAWKQTHGFTDAMASRYMRLFTSFTSAEDRERLSTIGIMAALEEAGIVKPRKSQSNSGETVRSQKPVPESSDCEKEQTTGPRSADRPGLERISQTAPKPTPLTTPSWAVSEDDDDDSDEEQYSEKDDPLAQVYSRSETLEEECRKAVPCQVRQLKEKVELLLTQPVEQLHHAWPTDPTERKQIVDDINGVIRLLPALAATIEAELRELAIAG